MLKYSGGIGMPRGRFGWLSTIGSWLAKNRGKAALGVGVPLAGAAAYMFGRSRSPSPGADVASLRSPTRPNYPPRPTGPIQTNVRTVPRDYTGAVQRSPYSAGRYAELLNTMRKPLAPADPALATPIPRVYHPQGQSAINWSKNSAYTPIKQTDSQGMDSKLRALLRFGPAVLAAIPAARWTKNIAAYAPMKMTNIKGLPDAAALDLLRRRELIGRVLGTTLGTTLGTAAGAGTAYGVQDLMDKNLKR